MPIQLSKPKRLVFASFPEVTQVVSEIGRPDDGTDAAGLLRNADAAMYEVKDAGRNGFRFSSRRRPAKAVSSVV